MTIPVGSFGPQMRMSINYDYCHLRPKRTARKLLGAHDILTGPMRGFYITRYNNGGNDVSHVGKVGVPAVDALVKRTFCATMPQNVSGFNPFQAWQVWDMVAVSQRHGMTIQFIALVTTTGDFYAIAMIPDSRRHSEWVCGGAKKVPALSYAQ